MRPTAASNKAPIVTAAVSRKRCCRFDGSENIGLVGLVDLGEEADLNRHRFFDQDSNVDNDIPAVRKVRIEVVAIPWFVVTTLILILLISFWLA